MDGNRDSGYYTGGRGGYYMYPSGSYSTMPAGGARGAQVYRVVVPQQGAGGGAPQVIHLGGGGGGGGGAPQPQVIRITPRSTDASGGSPGPQVIRLTGDRVRQGVRVVPTDPSQRIRVVQDSGAGSTVQYMPGGTSQPIGVVQGGLPPGMRIIQMGGGPQQHPVRTTYTRETPQGIRIVSSDNSASSPQVRQQGPGVRIFPAGGQAAREMPVEAPPDPASAGGQGRFKLIQMPQGFRLVSSEPAPPQQVPRHQPVRVVRVNSRDEDPSSCYSTYSTLPTRSSGPTVYRQDTTSVSQSTPDVSHAASPVPESPGSSQYGSLDRKKITLTPGKGSENITLSPSSTGSFSFSVDGNDPNSGIQMAEALDADGEKVYLIKMMQPKNKETKFQEAYVSRQNRRKLQEFDDLVANNLDQYIQRREARFGDRSSNSPQRGEGRGSPVTVTVHTPATADRDSPIRFHIRRTSQDQGDPIPRSQSADGPPSVHFERQSGVDSPTQAPAKTLLRSSTLDNPSSAESTPKNLFNRCKFNFGSIGNFNRSNSRESSSDSDGSGNVVFFQDFDDMIGRIRKTKGERGAPHPEGCMCRGDNSPKHGDPTSRPKSFLREEVDEFDRIFSELVLTSNEKFEEMKCRDRSESTMDEFSKARSPRASCHSPQTEDGERTPTFRSPRASTGHSPQRFCDTTTNSGAATSSSSPAGGASSQRDSGLFESNPLHSKFGKLFEDNEKLFSQLLDDLDNISGSNNKSLQRRRRARDLFSDWLFSEDALSPEQPIRQRCREALKDMTRRRVQSATESYDMRPREAVFTRWRPKSFEYLSEDDADSGYHTGNSTLQGSREKPPPGERTLTREDLRRRIETFNNNQHGLIMSLQQESETFQGFIRVHMNLIRPINMSVSTRPPSIYDLLTNHDSDSEDTVEDAQITSFYLPKDTTKVIHIDSETTAQEVIRALLSKFKITDNPRKFALYIKTTSAKRETRGGMQRLSDDETPLRLCLSWTDEGLVGLDKFVFILQENDTGEIMWDAFSLPELENFLRILGREEDEYCDQLKNKYRLLKIQMSKRLQELAKDRPKESTEQFPPPDKREPVFV